MTETVESFFGWIKERHNIYLSRAAGNPPPWTEDPILANYKFTNPFRENDRVTVWMRQNWTNLQDTRPHEEILFNTCMFRMIGTSEFAEEHGWVSNWEPEYTKRLIEKRIAQKLRTFTGAYIITNQGLKMPKSQVVVDYFLTPIWNDRKDLVTVMKACNTLQNSHEFLGKYKGWGGGGFMAYEVVTDLNYTPVLPEPLDRYSWANAGPGAVRGLNRIHDRKLTKGLNQKQANDEMRQLLVVANQYLEGSCVPVDDVDMRTIEHSLCEWDKYERVRLKQGEPRSLFRVHEAVNKTPVLGTVNQGIPPVSEYEDRL